MIAGGTDWFPAQGERPTQCAMLDVTRVQGLRGITQAENGWRFGAATTWSDIAHAKLPPAFDCLKQAALEVGSVQIQNAGTIAGNLCNASPAADGVPPLLALNARVEVTSSKGTRVLDLPDFVQGVRKIALGTDELVTAILIPDVSPDRKSAFVKLGARKYLVISIAMVAVSCRIEDGALEGLRIAVGACSPVAKRMPQLEDELKGKTLEQAIETIGVTDFSTLSPISDVRGTDVYRLDVVGPLISRALKEAVNG